MTTNNSDNKIISLETILNQEIKVKKEAKANEIRKKFSWVLFFAGDEFDKQLVDNKEISEKNIINFAELRKEKGGWIETKIKAIHQDSQNEQSIAEKNFPIIWFKDIDKLTNNKELEEVERSLLPIFDHQQNTELFGGEVNLSDYILIATSSTFDISKLPAPLLSRLECANIKTVKAPTFFLDRNFGWLLVSSWLLVLMLLAFLWYKPQKTAKFDNSNK